MSTQPGLLRALRAVSIDLKPIHCGGDDPIMQQREQWTDGANAFCLAPGVITSYGRNIATAVALDQAGYQVVSAGEVLADASLDLLDGGKYLVQIEAGELSRARGGPRCMTMPLSREGG
jgi:arginine deiminase